MESNLTFPTDVLTTEEVESIYQHYSHPKLSDDPGLIQFKFPTHQRYKYEDTIEMEIEKVSEFVLEEELLDPSKGFYNKEEDKVKLAIDVIIDEPKTAKIISDPNKSNGTLSMEIEKLSEFVREINLNGNWSRKCSGTLQIVTQKNDVGDFTRKFDHVFNNNSNDWGFIYFISFAELMEPSKGLYNKDEDKVTLAIDFTCE
ncbi:hypothetical protein niasHT_018721 [Heterodera trifolii]|uniref:Uncharacterized protein n=1 Tax=Heterodera trifolii TaxID=157864 RepID=A0ABD2LBA9_9BILA